jgi:maleate isomerase
MDATYELDAKKPVQLGLVVLQADETIERDMRRLLLPEVELLVSRVPSGTEVTPDSLHAMQEVLTEAAALLPTGANFSAVGYGCTSGTAQIGAVKIKSLIQDGIKTPHVSEPVSALIAACSALDVKKIGLLSPYIEPVSDRLRQVLAEAGITVTRLTSFNEPVEENVVRISGKSTVEAALKLANHDDCDVVFISCTNLRTLDVIETIEAMTGKPVLSSNQVLAWHLCQLAGLDVSHVQFGSLFKRAMLDP